MLAWSARVLLAMSARPKGRTSRLPEPQGPWSLPPAPKPPSLQKRLPLGLVVWVGLLAAGGLAYWALTALFPGQLAGGDQAQVFYALGLLALVSSGLVYAQRVRLGAAARDLAIWVAIGVTILVGYTFRDELAGVFTRVRGEVVPAYAVPTSDHALVLTASDDGHFYVIGQVNGAPVRFIVDTGSTEVVLSPADAQRAGVDLAKLTFASPGETANGVGYDAQTTVTRLAVGPIQLANVAVAVNKTPMSASLLGMSFLRRVDIETHGDQMTLRWRD
jgi:aspartyl protease family protein